MNYIKYYIVDNKNYVHEIFDYFGNAREFLKNIPNQYKGLELHEGLELRLEKRKTDSKIGTYIILKKYKLKTYWRK